jgi:malate dehydrogenase (oxaloacetate-decarboxylating)
MRDVMIREGVPREEATRRFFALGSRGLLVDDSARLRDFQVPYARPAAEVAGWTRDEAGDIGLAEVVSRVRPTMLIGTSAQAGAFTEKIITEMAAYVVRPIVMPLSNPTSKCEALPEDVVRWTGGRALIATGSPFPPVTLGASTFHIAQANNALVFPGLGLGVTVARARRITDSMIMAAADAVAGLAGDPTPGAPLLPAVDDLRVVSAAVAIAVAVEAERQGLAQVPLHDPIKQVHDAMWKPEYPRLEIQ